MHEAIKNKSKMKFNLPYSSGLSSSRVFHSAGAEEVCGCFSWSFSTLVFSSAVNRLKNLIALITVMGCD